jgi:exopolysaccharide production protein ExoQ
MLSLFGIVGLMRKGRNRLTLNGGLGWLILFYFVWVSLSVAWADDVAFTLRRLIPFWMFCLGALAVVRHFSSRDIILWIFLTTGVFLLMGIGSEILLGTFRPFTPGYRFAGLRQPNSQGYNCSLLLLTALAMGRGEKRYSRFFLLCACVGLIFLVLTGSRSAFASGIAALFVYWVLVSSRSSKLIWPLGIGIGIGIVACLLALLVGEDLHPILRQGVLLGRPDSETSSLTGRIPLWELCLGYAARRPLQGYGYNGFFTPSRITEIAATQEWAVLQAHSAYGELLLSTGMVGLISFVLILIFSIKKSLVHYRASLSPGYACFVAIFVFSMLQGVLESLVVTTTTLAFVVMVVVVHLGFTVPSGPRELDLERR